MPSRSIGDSVRRLAEGTALGIKRGRIFQMNDAMAIVQTDKDATLAKTSTDEPLRAGDAVWCQPVKQQRRLVIHGR